MFQRKNEEGGRGKEEGLSRIREIKKKITKSQREGSSVWVSLGQPCLLSGKDLSSDSTRLQRLGDRGLILSEDSISKQWLSGR